MKLLFDHHLSPSLVHRLRDLFPGSEHVWNIATGVGCTPTQYP